MRPITWPPKNRRAANLAAEAARVAKAAEEAAAAEKAAKELETVKGAAKDKRTCKVDPVDVTNGVMLFDNLDVELPGPVPFQWERTWYSNSEHQGMLGHGWHHQYDLALWVSPDGLVACRLADGRLALFDPLSKANNFCAFNRKEKLELRQADASYQLYDCSNRLHYSFTPSGQRTGHYQLQAVGNTSGFAIRFRYNEHGHLHTIIDSAGRELRLQTDTAGRILTLELPHPSVVGQYIRAMQYAYDEVGNMTAATDALGNRLEYYYRGHLMVQKKFRNGMSFYFEYDGTDSSARCVRSWGDGNLLNGRFYYEPGHTVFTTDLPGDRSEYFHHNGLVTAHLDPVGALREWHYNEFDELELERDPLGHTTVYDYDARGHLAGITSADGSQVQTHYEQDLPVEATDALGNHWRWRYNEEHNLTARIDPDGIVTRYEYQRGLLHKVSVAGGPPTVLAYDAAHNLQEVRQPEGQQSSWQYDALGRVMLLTDARGNTQQRAYDLLGRLRRIQEPDGNVRTLTYDAEDNVVRAQDVHQDVVLEYTGLDWLAARTQAGTQVQYHYDTAGQLTQLLNEQGRANTFERNAAGQVVAETRFDGQRRRYLLDAAGQVLTQWVADQATSYAYDALGRLIQTTFPDGSQEQFTFRPDGALLTATNDHATVSWERDARGRILHETQGAHMVSSSYDRAGRRIGLSSTLGAAVEFAFDQYGEVQRMQTDGWQAHFEHDAQGLETQRTFSGGVQASWQRDRLGRPVSQLLRVGRTQRQRQYEWQPDDRLAQLTDSATGTTRFAHDDLGALVATHYPDGTQELRLPDAVGNLFQTPTRQDRTYGPGGQLKEANGTRYKYDALGNLVRKQAANGQAWHYQWNGAGQLASVRRPDGYTVSFVYDALGRRISKRFRGKVTHWVWDGHKPLHEWTELELGPEVGSADTLITWLFEENNFAPVARLAGAQRESILTDHLGTPLELVDGQSRRTWRAELNSYGGVRTLDGARTGCPFRYQGQYEDAETGLYYNRFRYYDPEAGQYLSQDPIGLAGGMAAYAYVPDPTKWVDPFGLSKCPTDPRTISPWNLFQRETRGQFATMAERRAAYRHIRGGSPYPMGFIQAQEDIAVGTRVKIAMGPKQLVEQPGAFAVDASKTDITSVEYVREQLAVKYLFKPEVGYVQEYEVIKSVPVIKGPIGPQLDLDLERVLKGGENQIEFKFPDIIDATGKKIYVDRMDYLKPIGLPKKIY